MSNLVKRILTGVIAGGVTVGAMIFSSWGVLVFCAVVSLLGLYEFYKINGIHKKAGSWVFIIYGFAFWVVTGVWGELSFGPQSKAVIFMTLGGIGVLFVLPFIYILALFSKKEKDPIGLVAKSIFGFLYSFVPIQLLFGIGFDCWNTGLIGSPGLNLKVPSSLYNPFWLSHLAFLFLFWTNDIMAYFGGKLLGKRKLFESVSPKKTWEGTIVGAICTIGLGVFLDYQWSGGWDLIFKQKHSWNWIVVAIIIALFGQIGDLVQSKFKRSLDLKDSGGILPGHGGILDRFDAVYFVMPIIAIYYVILITRPWTWLF